MRVFEAVPEIHALGVGINLLPHSVSELWQLDLREPLDATAIRTGALRYHATDGKTIWSEPRGIDAGYPCPQYSIHRGELQQILLSTVRLELGSAAVVTGHRFTHVSQTHKRVSAHFREEGSGVAIEPVDGDCLIGADGIMSTVRSGFYPDEGNPVYAGQILWRGVTEAEPFADGRTMVMIGNNALKAVVYPIAARPNGRQLINWIAERAIDKALPQNKGDWNKPGDKADFLEYFTNWNFDWLDMPKLFAGSDGCWEFPMVDRDPVARWSFDRVTLIGDAAHAMRPNGSNGASQAILDAVALAGALHDETRIEAALKRYETARLTATAALTLSNRQTGPEVVLQMVHERCPDGFDDIYDHFTEAELTEIADSYKQLAGFTTQQVAAAMRQPDD